MVDKSTRTAIEDIANLVSLQIVRPIEQRLTAIETKIQCQGETKKTSIDAKWKLIGLAISFPGIAAALVKVLESL